MSHYECIGSCSICGGDVMAFRGPWAGVGPPPRPRCSSCNAMAARGPVIPMEPPRRSASPEAKTQTKDWAGQATVKKITWTSTEL